MITHIIKPGLLLLILALTGTRLMAQRIGATVPWTSYEAESGSTNGIAHSGSDNRMEVSYEASGRSVIELNAPGSYVAIRSTVKANRITFRYSVPKGTTAIIALFINKSHKKDITLGSERIWNAKPALPGGLCRFFDEIIIEQTVKPGDNVRLVRKNTDTVSSMIDLIDLEMAPDALKKPDNTWLDITDYGAKGNDDADDTKAINDCINAAVGGSEKVWIPAGNYYINDQINVPPGVKIAGAGMWHTVIKKNIPAANVKRAFQLKDSTEIKNLKLEDIVGNIRINGHEGIRFSSSTDVVIDGIWIANTFGAGILGSNANNITIKNCRLTGTFADAIHISRKSTNCIAENNLIRNSGDDGLAIVTYNSAGCHDIVYRNNTVWFNYWGRGITMIGGDHNTLERNLVIDGAKAGLLIAVEEYNKQITPYVTNFRVEYNKVIRCGDIGNRNMGGIWLWGNVQTSPMSGTVSNNEIIDPVRHGITITNWVPKEVIIQHNSIDEPGPDGQRIFSTLKNDFSPVISENKDVFTDRANDKKTVASPDKRTVFEINDSEGQLKYRVTYNGTETVRWSRLGLTFDNGIVLGNKAIVHRSAIKSHKESFPWRLGEKDFIQNNYNELTLSCSSESRSFSIIIRMFNGSVAFKYQVGSSVTSAIILKENTEFNLTTPYTIYHYSEESVFTPTNLDSLSGTSDLPSTLSSPSMHISIGEAANDSYTKPVLIKGSYSNSLAIGFVKDSVRVIGDNFSTPWRTISFSETLTGLQQFTDLNYRLAKAPEKGVPAWIRPGKLIRSWALTTEGGLSCIDFAVKNNYQYIMYDGGWYGKEFNTVSDPLTVIPQIDMKTVIDYGKKKNIGVILYVNYIGLRQYLDRILPLFKKWGVAGIKFGFVNGIKQEGILWLVKAIKKTMDYGFIINIHDNYKPTGLSRTYPALLTQEGIRGDEHQADAYHHTLLPFTRSLAGAGDNTFCFPPPSESHRVRPDRILITSKGQQLAMPVLYFSPLQSMVWYGLPEQYTNDTEIEFYKLVPTVWNESHYLKAELGKYVSIARRNGNNWFLGNIAGLEAWKDSIQLSFLEKGVIYNATIYSDNNSGGVSKQVIRVKKNSILPIDIKPSEGNAVYFEPVKKLKN